MVVLVVKLALAIVQQMVDGEAVMLAVGMVVVAPVGVLPQVAQPVEVWALVELVAV